MEKPLPNSELSPLSATKIKNLENCSWLYWVSYHLRLPQKKNEGSMKGDVCHRIFEILILPKHRKILDEICLNKTTKQSKALVRLIWYYMNDTGLPKKQSIYDQIDQMILVGLTNEFVIKGGTLLSPEYKFDISNEYFRIKGFMDKPFIKDNCIIIDDYKSSKQKFQGEEEESNLQALMYSYAAKHLWPNLKPVVRFIFLQFPENPIMTLEFNDEVLKGFERYLEYIQKRVNIFNERSATSSFAADQEPHDNGFNGKLLCGFAKKPDEKKKDGTPKWACPYKFGFEYYVVKKDNKISRSAFTLEELKLKPGEVFEKMNYLGCPRFISVIDEIDTKKTLQKKKSFPNVLDDF